jgi:hypothetical protein
MDRKLAHCLRRLSRHQGGATALEFALAAPVFILLIMGTVEFALIFAAQNLMESATYSASRLGKTGSGVKESTQKKLIVDELHRFAGIIVDTRKVKISSYAYTDYGEIGKPEPFIDANKNGVRDSGENYTDTNGNAQYDLDRGKSGHGGTSQVVVYTVEYPWEVFTPLLKPLIGTGGKLNLSTRAVVKNEPYE